MIIIFYDANNDEIYICSDKEPTKIVSIDDPDILSHIPNDDIIYVQNAHFITKKQFGDWLNGDLSLEPEKPAAHYPENLINNEYFDEPGMTDIVDYSESPHKGSFFIHPKHNGTIIINDLKTEKFPNGVQMNGKWDFIPIDYLGGKEALESSAHFKGLRAKGKIEVVDYEYVKKNRDKKHPTSRADAALDRIIVQDDRSGAAENVAANGGINGPNYGSRADSDVISIFVES